MDNLRNIGSIQKIEVLPANRVTISDADATNSVTVTAVLPWQDMHATIQSASFQEEESIHKAGPVYESRLRFVCPKISPANYVPNSIWVNLPVVIRITDGNGTMIVMGDADNPCYIIHDKNIPAEPGGFNGYGFSVKWESPHQARFTA
jgi:hypothetical protein